MENVNIYVTKSFSIEPWFTLTEEGKELFDMFLVRPEQLGMVGAFIDDFLETIKGSELELVPEIIARNAKFPPSFPIISDISRRVIIPNGSDWEKNNDEEFNFDYLKSFLEFKISMNGDKCIYYHSYYKKEKNHQITIENQIKKGEWYLFLKPKRTLF